MCCKSRRPPSRYTIINCFVYKAGALHFIPLLLCNILSCVTESVGSASHSIYIESLRYSATLTKRPWMSVNRNSRLYGNSIYRHRLLWTNSGTVSVFHRLLWTNSGTVSEFHRLLWTNSGTVSVFQCVCCVCMCILYSMSGDYDITSGLVSWRHTESNILWFWFATFTMLRNFDMEWVRTDGHEKTHRVVEDMVLFTWNNVTILHCLQVFRMAAVGPCAQSGPFQRAYRNRRMPRRVSGTSDGLWVEKYLLKCWQFIFQKLSANVVCQPLYATIM